MSGMICANVKIWSDSKRIRYNDAMQLYDIRNPRVRKRKITDRLRELSYTGFLSVSKTVEEIVSIVESDFGGVDE